MHIFTIIALDGDLSADNKAKRVLKRSTKTLKVLVDLVRNKQHLKRFVALF